MNRGLTVVRRGRRLGRTARNRLAGVRAHHLGQLCLPRLHAVLLDLGLLLRDLFLAILVLVKEIVPELRKDRVHLLDVARLETRRVRGHGHLAHCTKCLNEVSEVEALVGENILRRLQLEHLVSLLDKGLNAKVRVQALGLSLNAHTQEVEVLQQHGDGRNQTHAQSDESEGADAL